MANHDPNASSMDGGNSPMVPAPMNKNDVQQSLMIQQPYASPNFVRTPSVVTGGMDASGFVNALRRRWMLATFMGLLLAGGVGAALFFLFPESDTAVARFIVRADTMTIIEGPKNISGARDFDIFRATQVAQMKSFNVINTALSNPSITNSKLLNEADNAAMWLADNIDVRFEGDSELMRISLTQSTGSDGDEMREELRNIVNAMCDAYKEQVVTKNRYERSEIRETLIGTFKELNEDIRDKWEEYRTIANDLGIAADGQYDPSVRMLFEQLTAKLKERRDLEEQIRGIQLEYARWKSFKDNPDLKEQNIIAQVSADENILMMEQELLYLQMQKRDAEKRSRGRMNSEVQRVQTQIDQQNQLIQRERAQLRQQIEQQMANAPDIELALYTQEFNRQLQVLGGRLQQLKDGYDVPSKDGEVIRELGISEIVTELEAKAQGSTELVVREAEIKQLEQVAEDLGRRIQAWEIEEKAEERIELYESAYILPGINKLQHYAITGIGSLATLVVACLGIAYLEFLGRRLNGPKQVDEGLGIRVVGTLPKLKARHQAQITESIDSVRTALMHESSSKQRQVVMITSPRAMEGRTTVASQLAGSLARAGRRTLLIDGDLRRPALHSLFNVPLEDGLCEVLRAEADVSDVVRATSAEGLWLMTAGYCDAEAVHAMATDQIQPIFDKLRSEYDFVIIDGAPVLGLSDSLMMGQHCDGALLSVLRDHTTVPDIYQSSELLRSVGVRLIGSVVNGVSAKSDRRVSHLQVAAPKSNRKQIKSKPAEASVASEPSAASDDNDFDFSDLSDD
ncbi:polysaccharide biosynthesis tyrosine autokinase [Aeoliella mucimassa]|uniref:non-specific protein-tyrosine kinase n=1 Tax=Aeoliella mucimassa TaxID=2527972 RepID=A0A518AGV5_9BACT|nr:polysaccharide biosynthesis tyrosine autokinase [Aeoliella mucimassa]QDU53942.1 Tyrosine-protein kinase ptk [Aeoliella mucimassa]